MRVTMIAGLCVLACGLVRADDPKPASAGEADLRAARAAHDTIELGVGLYNKGDRDGCFRVYQGSVVALLPSLGHRPALAAKVKAKLESAAAMPAAQGAFTLREALDAVVNATNPAAKPLWDRLGGEKAVRAVVHDFVAAAAPDPKVNFLRDGKFKLDAKGVALLEQQLVELVSVVSGGPLKYTGRDMKTAHAGMKITDAEFDALAGHLIATLKKYNVPQTELNELVEHVAATRKDIVEAAPKADPLGKKPLWDRLGGEKAVRAVVVEFLTAAAKDPKVNLDRSGNYPLTKDRVARVEQTLVEFVSLAAGGPLKYTGRDMKTSHAGMKITTAEFNAAAGHLVAVLKKFNVPQAEIDELVGAVAGTAKDIVEVK